MDSLSDINSLAGEASKQLSKIQVEYGYKNIDSEFSLAGVAGDYWASKFSCGDQPECIEQVAPSKVAIVTGFGPTNAPTAGTLSVLLKVLSLQKVTGFYTEMIISDLGVWNSRNLAWQDIENNTQRFLGFIDRLGFNHDNGNLRTHQDLEMLKVSGVIAKTLNLSDLEHNQEASIPLYDAMELGGSGLGPVVDNLYTVADILKPLFSGYERVLVIAGLEEHYLLRLAHLVIERLHIHYPNTFIPKDSNIGALFTRLVPGLHPYPKMSKSIPASFIGIGEPKDEIVKKIINGSDKNEMVILEMIKQVSDWPFNKVMVAQNAFDSRRTNPSEWCLVKEEYLSYFLDLHQKWKASSQSDSQETSVPDKKW